MLASRHRLAEPTVASGHRAGADTAGRRAAQSQDKA